MYQILIQVGSRGDSESLSRMTEEEEEHHSSADSPVNNLYVDQFPPSGDTERFETDSQHTNLDHLQIRIPPANALQSMLPQPLHHHYLCIFTSTARNHHPITTSPTDTGAPLGYRAAGIRMRASDASPPLSLPPTSPRTDIPEAEMPPSERSLS
ncbi:hypothetical protein Tco_1029796 [Tanacetum coccineum]|uniref:Uncharacterized protein n=1 Tax=Tanacetum coccineum TaxID=301880 RepID=A0ABQ5G4R9_9ASTR